MRAVREDRAGEREDVLVQGGARRARGESACARRATSWIIASGLNADPSVFCRADAGRRRWRRGLLAENRRRERRDGGALVRRVLQEGPSATHERGSERGVRDVRGDDERWPGVAAQGRRVRLSHVREQGAHAREPARSRRREPRRKWRRRRRVETTRTNGRMDGRCTRDTNRASSNTPPHFASREPSRSS